MLTRAHGDAEAEKLLGRAQTVNAGYGRDHDHVVALAQRAGRRIAEFIYLVVHGEVFFDIGIRRGDITFRLIVIVIGNEVLHAVFGKKLTKFVAKLRRKRFVVRDHERGTPRVFDYVRHGKRFSASGNADEHLRADPVQNAFGQFFDRLGLIARGLECGS